MRTYFLVRRLPGAATGGFRRRANRTVARTFDGVELVLHMREHVLAVERHLTDRTVWIVQING